MASNPFPNYISGTWVCGNNVAANLNPSDLNDTLGYHVPARALQTAEAIECAAAAFPQWRATSPLVRFEALDRIGSELLARGDEMGGMLAREEGKTLPEAKADVHLAGHLIKYFAAEAYRTNGEMYQSLHGAASIKAVREPISVAGAITPWNFPLAIPAWEIAPALTYGNTVVFKLAELVPASAWILSDPIARVGLPEGVFNLVMGTGTGVGEAMVAHPDVSGVTFTGSTPVGRKIGAALFGRGATMQLEMGGKNPLVVLDDANLDLAVHCAIQCRFYSTGQRCTASSRLIVTAGIFETFKARLSALVKELEVDDARAPPTQIGPVLSKARLVPDKKYIKEAIVDGATLAAGGDDVTSTTLGYYLSPAVFTGFSPKSALVRDEIFGPIAAVLRVTAYDAALDAANDCEFGFSAGIVSQDLAKIDHFSQSA